jgi:hypothetical protein
MTRLDPPTDANWRSYLHALPESEPPAELLSRLQQARSARRAPSWRWMAVAAAVVASALVVASLPDPERAAIATVAPAAIDPALQQLDLELSLAYARQADEDEIAALWQTRERLLAHTGEDGSVLLARL